MLFQEYQVPLFGMSLSACREEAVPVSQALCLPVSVAELVQANQLGSVSAVVKIKKVSRLILQFHEFQGAKNKNVFVLTKNPVRQGCCANGKRKATEVGVF